jgi:hypothetical protein
VADDPDIFSLGATTDGPFSHDSEALRD